MWRSKREPLISGNELMFRGRRVAGAQRKGLFSLETRLGPGYSGVFAAAWFEVVGVGVDYCDRSNLISRFVETRLIYHEFLFPVVNC